MRADIKKAKDFYDAREAAVVEGEEQQSADKARLAALEKKLQVWVVPPCLPDLPSSLLGLLPDLMLLLHQHPYCLWTWPGVARPADKLTSCIIVQHQRS